MMSTIKDLKYCRRFMLGVGFTFVIALIGYMLALIPGFNRVGPLASAILLAITYRQTFGYPHFLQPGIHFSTRYLLRLAIILYGLKLNINVILEDGLGLLAQSTGVILFSILLTVYLANRLKGDKKLALLLGVGTGVCGAAAIVAISPIIQAKEDQTAISVGIIAFIGTMVSIIYAILYPFLPLTDLQYGVWSGISLHELAHVALAAEPAGVDALAIALLAKLSRVFLLVPLCFIFIYWMNQKKDTGDSDEREKSIPFPWFLLGFIAMSVFASYIANVYVPISVGTMSLIDMLTTFILTSAMVGLGLNVNLQDVKNKALRPLVAMIITSVLLSVFMFYISST